MLTGTASTPEGTRLYVIGDVHGCLAELTSLFAMIERDMALADFDTCRIITIGDYVDRGPESSGVIDYLIEMSNSHDLVCLLGNHDQRLLEFMDIPETIAEPFFYQGGRETVASYGIDVGSEPDMRMVSRAMKRTMPKAHLRFLNNLQLIHQEGDYAFCHAGIRPEIPIADQQASDLLWIREPFLVWQKPHEKVIVHGHTIHDFFDVQPNRINVDTGAFATGVLTCAVLQGSEIDKLQTRGLR